MVPHWNTPLYVLPPTRSVGGCDQIPGRSYLDLHRHRPTSFPSLASAKTQGRRAYRVPTDPGRPS